MIVVPANRKLRWWPMLGCTAFGLLGTLLIVAGIKAKFSGVTGYVTSGGAKTAPMFSEQVVLVGALVLGSTLYYAIKTRPRTD